MAGHPRPVSCSSCEMWEFKDPSGVPGSFTCKTCVQLQLLFDRLMALELRMDSLWSICDAEEVVDSMFSELVTPQIKITEGDREWVTTRQRKSRKAVQGSPMVISLQNRYTILDTVGGDGSRGDGGSCQIHCTMVGSAAQEGGKKSGRAIVIGDSIVKGIDRRFCGSKRCSRMVCCLPGARVKDVL